VDREKKGKGEGKGRRWLEKVQRREGERDKGRGKGERKAINNLTLKSKTRKHGFQILMLLKVVISKSRSFQSDLIPKKLQSLLVLLFLNFLQRIHPLIVPLHLSLVYHCLHLTMV
jgi:hypothetical protein